MSEKHLLGEGEIKTIFVALMLKLFLERMLLNIPGLYEVLLYLGLT